MSDNKVLISICIPAYKNTLYIKRLLDSIAIQTFKNFEVIVTDDSPNTEVEQLCNEYYKKLNLKYFKNDTNLNTPENWNEGIRRATGRWIKLMHDDDWFSQPTSLQHFARAIEKNSDCNFFFSAYANVYEGTGKVQSMFLKPFWKKALSKNANILIADNVIGPPSVTLHTNNCNLWYDRNMKYVVDIDFYIRFLEKTKTCYINEPLINVGINKAQVTKYTFNVPEVHLKESLYLMQKTGEKHLKNLLVFDGWWRLLRNFKIQSVADIRSTGYDGVVPQTLINIIEFQKKIPYALLKKGAFSKLMMSLCYALLAPK